MTTTNNLFFNELSDLKIAWKHPERYRMLIRWFFWVLGIVRDKSFYVEFDIQARGNSTVVSGGSVFVRTRFLPFDAPFVETMKHGVLQQSNKDPDRHIVRIVMMIRISGRPEEM